MGKTRKLLSDNPRQSLRILLKRLSYPHAGELYKTMYKHPDFPSFLSFHHTLKGAGINNVAVRVSYDELRETVPMPALVHVTTNVEAFMVIDRVEEEQVFILDERNEQEAISKKVFLTMWHGNVLVLDTENVKPPKPQPLAGVKRMLSALQAPFVIFALVALFAYLALSIPRSALGWAYLALYAVGIGVSVLLLLQQLDKHNPLVRKLCTSQTEGSKRNCSSILDSKDAYFMGLVSWSDVGFLFFAVLFLLLLIFPQQAQTLAILSSLPAFGYVFYSIGYQRFVARSWCTLCLCVQAVLSALFVLSLCSLSSVNLTESLSAWLPLTLTTIGTIALYLLAKPLVQAKVAQRPLEYRYKQLKHDDDVRAVLFNRQPVYTTEGLSTLSVGVAEASSCITVVFSPVCEPCINELSTLIPILRTKADTRLELIFLLDQKKHPHVTAIAQRLIKGYLNAPDSFLDTLEHYVVSYPKSKHKMSLPLNEDTESMDKLLREHEAWWKANKIYATPLILLNGSRLPDTYDLYDLDYMCY